MIIKHFDRSFDFRYSFNQANGKINQISWNITGELQGLSTSHGWGQEAGRAGDYFCSFCGSFFALFGTFWEIFWDTFWTLFGTLFRTLWDTFMGHFGTLFWTLGEIFGDTFDGWGQEVFLACFLFCFWSMKSCCGKIICLLCKILLFSFHFSCFQVTDMFLACCIFFFKSSSCCAFSLF